MGAGIRGILRIGSSSNFARYELPMIFNHFVNQHPNVEIQLKTGSSNEIMHMLHSEEV